MTRVFMHDQAWVVIPAFNEAARIRSVVEAVRTFGYQVVVVDDGSSDDTATRLEASGCHLVRHSVNLGQGAALQTGIEYAVNAGAAYVVTFDADGQHQSADIERILEPLTSGRCDVTLGTRFARGGRALHISRMRRAILAVAVLYSRMTLGLALTDTHNGLRGFTAATAAALNITQNRMAHATQILARIKQHRWRYEEVPVTIEYSEYSVGKGQSMFNLFGILWESTRELLLGRLLHREQELAGRVRQDALSNPIVTENTPSRHEAPEPCSEGRPDTPA